MAQELAQKDRHFRNMLSEIKFKSENMRRKKLNQGPSSRVQPQAKGQPSFMSSKDAPTEIENILKLRVDQNVIREFMGQ